MFWQAAEVGCTLLLLVNNEFKDVAKGSILQPMHRKFHGADMPHSVHRVVVHTPLPGCRGLYPPNQPAEAEGELKVAELKNHILLWPKSLIRLNAALGLAPSQGKVTPPIVPCSPRPVAFRFVSAIIAPTAAWDAAHGFDCG